MAEKEEVKVLAELTIGEAPFTQVKLGRQYSFGGQVYSNKDWSAYKKAEIAKAKAAGQPEPDFAEAIVQYRYGINLGKPDLTKRATDLADFAYDRLASVLMAALAEADEATITDALKKFVEGGWEKRLDGEREKAARAPRLLTVEDVAVNNLTISLMQRKGVSSKEEEKKARAKVVELKAAGHPAWKMALQEAEKMFGKKYAGLDDVDF